MIPPKIDTVVGYLCWYPGLLLDQSIWLSAISLSKSNAPLLGGMSVLPLGGANKIVTEIGGVVKKKIELFSFNLF